MRERCQPAHSGLILFTYDRRILSVVEGWTIPPEVLNHTLYSWLALTDPSPAVLFLFEAIAAWPVFVLPLGICGLWAFGQVHDRRAAVNASVAACLALAIAHQASQLVVHPRPFMVGLAPNRLDHAPDSSFPSDHATLFFALGAALMLQPTRSAPKLGAVLALVGLAVGWARIALGIHFPFDVVGSALIASASAVVITLKPLRFLVNVANAVAERVRWHLPLNRLAIAREHDARPSD